MGSFVKHWTYPVPIKTNCAGAEVPIVGLKSWQLFRSSDAKSGGRAELCFGQGPGTEPQDPPFSSHIRTVNSWPRLIESWPFSSPSACLLAVSINTENFSNTNSFASASRRRVSTGTVICHVGIRRAVAAMETGITAATPHLNFRTEKYQPVWRVMSFLCPCCSSNC